MDTAREPTSAAEQFLVEKSQDSVKVYKQRLHRQSLTGQSAAGKNCDSPEVDPDAQSREAVHQSRLAQKDDLTQENKQLKKTKSRFPARQDAVEIDADSKRERRSLTRRISDALAFRKTQPSAADAALDLEHSPPSVHVTFQQQPQVIE